MTDPAKPLARFIINGTQAGAPFQQIVDGSSEAAVRRWAAKHGIEVGTVTPVPLDPGTSNAAADERHVFVTVFDVHPSAAFKLGFFGALGAAAVWIVVAVIAALISAFVAGLVAGR